MISLCGHNLGDEDSLNGCNGGSRGTTTIQVVIEAEAQAGICRLMCIQLWWPKSTTLHHAKKSRNVEHKPILQMGSYRMLQREAYHRPFMVRFPDKCVWQNKFNPENEVGLALYTDGSKTNKGTVSGV